MRHTRRGCGCRLGLGEERWEDRDGETLAKNDQALAAKIGDQL